MRYQTETGTYDEDYSLWKIFLEYISNMKMGEIVTRQQLIELKTFESINTVDSYKYLFLKAKVLETIKPGVYKKVRELNQKWTISEFTEIALGKSFKSWFIVDL